MPTVWNCLYLPFNEHSTVAQALEHSLTQRGYTLYNPFGILPGKSYPRSARLFVSPVRQQWVKVLGTLDEALVADVSRLAVGVWLSLDGTSGHIRTYRDGQEVDPFDSLTPYLRAGCTAQDLAQALNGNFSADGTKAAEAGLPFDALPDDIKALSGKVNSGQAEKLFNRLSGNLMKKVAGGSGQAEAAQNLVQQGDGSPDWNSAGGQRVSALMACLNVPDNWREPAFDALRDAYQLHSRRQRNPNARAYPGDEAVMAAVPDALMYTPVYGGADA